MNIIKRNKEEVLFDRNKICRAVEKASAEVPSEPMSKGVIDRIGELVEAKCQELQATQTVEQVQDMVETELMRAGYYETARHYITYRYERQLARQSNTTDDAILSLLGRKNEELNQENSNKNPVINSTQRDYMAGEVSKDLTMRVLLPQDIVQAHKEGIIHFHDADYFAQPEYNCFDYSTKFITNEGVRTFGSCIDGEQVTVLDMYGKWRQATVHTYGKGIFYDVTLKSRRTIKKVRCTANHRWILRDGTVTTHLQVGDKLALLEETDMPNILDKYFCMGFVIGDGCDNQGGQSVVRLCSDKKQYLPYFQRAGYHVSTKPMENGDLFVRNDFGAFKQDFLDTRAWRFLTYEQKVSIFLGYYAADGHKDRNGCTTADDRIAQMIRDLSAVAGYHIVSEKEEIRNTNYKENAKLISFRFMRHQIPSSRWEVVGIEKYGRSKRQMWCVEEPITHTFTLDGGIVTGNCCLCNLDDILQNGTVISDTLIEKPHSFATACTIATQVIAQVSSNRATCKVFEWKIGMIG